MSKSYKAFAPATISNLSSGFDLLGLALEEPGDYVLASKTDEGIVKITGITGHKDGISLTNNTAVYAVRALLDSLNESCGISLKIDKGYAHSSGLGSSAASAVAAVVATNAVLGKPYKQPIDLLPFAYAGELSVDKNLPMDNVAASLLGGIILSHPHKAPLVLPIPEGIFMTVVRPHIGINTKEERAGLSDHIPLHSHIQQSHNLSSLILGLYRSNWDMISDGLEDVVIEPQRKSLIPFFDDIKNLAINQGALGCSISGSGPSVFAFCNNSLVAENISLAWAKHYGSVSIEHDLYISRINLDGAHIC